MIVHKLSGDLANESGFARRASESYNPLLDGAVVLYSAFGIGTQFTDLDPNTNLNRTITHLAGHYLNLYDTYEGDEDGSICPPNQNCQANGDRCCDTPPHIRSNNTCNANTSCGSQAPISNYMDNSSESCKSEFTLDQKTRMRNNLEYSRLSLLNSLGCKPPCLEDLASFIYNPTQGDLPLTVQLTPIINTNEPILSYAWYLNDELISTDSLATIILEQHACVQVCFAIETANCVFETCQYVNIIPGSTIDPCACNLNNGDDIDFSYWGTPSAPNTPACEDLTLLNHYEEFENVTPWHCYFSDDNDFYLGGNFDTPWNFSSTTGEFIISKEPIVIPAGTYDVSIMYSVQKKRDGTDGEQNSMNIQMALLKNLQSGSGSFTNIAAAQNVNFDYPSTAGFHTDSDYFCFPSHYENDNPEVDLELEWHQAKYRIFTREITEEDSTYLLIGGFNNYGNLNTIYFKEPCISYCADQCGIAYAFNATINGCDANFTTTSSEPTTDFPEFYWSYGDGTPIDTVGNNTHTFGWSGTFEVCMSYMCGGSLNTFCQDIYIEEEANCESCIETFAEFSAKQCSETDSYIGAMNIPIPSGYTLCNEDNQAIWSENDEINVTSAYIDEDTNELSLSYEVAPNDPDFIDNIPFRLTLCSPSGKPICFNFSIGIKGEQCESCVENTITATASCDERNNNGEAPYTYTGSMSLPNGLNLCGGAPEIISSEAGLSITNTSPTGIDFDIYTNKENPFMVSGLIEICVIEGGKKVNKCIPFRIDVDRICPRKKKDPRTRSISENVGLNQNMRIINNPAIGNLLIEFNNPLNSDEYIEIYSLDGKLKLRQKTNSTSKNINIDVSNFESGLYIVNYDKKQLSRKVMIIN